MAVNTQRILKDASGIAEDIGARSKKLYEDTVDRLPEGSAQYAGIALGGIALLAGAYFLGRSKHAKHAHKAPFRKKDLELKDFDFKPFYRLARLWLIARLVD